MSNDKNPAKRNNLAQVEERLRRDACAIASFIEHKTGLEGVQVNIVIPYGWVVRCPDLCGVEVWSDGRAGLSTFTRNVLEKLGWRFDFGLDAADYLGFTTAEVSNHERLAGYCRIASVVTEVELSFSASK